MMRGRGLHEMLDLPLRWPPPTGRASPNNSTTCSSTANITLRAIDLRRIRPLPLLPLRRQLGLGGLPQDTLQRRQKDHAIEVLLNRLHTGPTKPLHFKDILEPIMIRFMLPPPAIDLFELSPRIRLRIEQIRPQHFDFPRRQHDFDQPQLQGRRQVLLPHIGSRFGGHRQRHDLRPEPAHPKRR